MKSSTKNEIFILPEYDEQGRRYYNMPNARADQNLVGVCIKAAEKVIPVIFIPGVMGSNLNNEDGEVWRSSKASLAKWFFANPRKRERLLDPQTTAVDQSGKIFNESADGNKFPSRRDRGWGSALYMSYGEPLDTIQSLLNDQDILLNNYVTQEKRKTRRQQIIGADMGAERGEDSPLTDAEVEHSYHFLYPLHVFGYNWLQSNAESAKHLGDYISHVREMYHGRLATDKVILITHSMGGLVARHYSENMGGRKNILGIVHGVMPDLGSPTAYRRMKTGERGLVGLVIGADAARLMPVLAQSPGPLQLLPGKAYGPGWLRIQCGHKTEIYPLSDPYGEIYLNQTAWWRLYEAGISGGDPAEEWKEYKTTMTGKVQGFIEDLNGKYHPHTWAFYGASNRNPSDEYLTWKALPPRPDYEPVTGTPWPLSPVQRKTAENTFELTSSGGYGDGTVPLRAGRISHKIHGLLATDVDHDGAYAIHPPGGGCGLSIALLFTLRAVIKIVQQVAEP